jgi:hydrogenase/urease accessory protein HupE
MTGLPLAHLTATGVGPLFDGVAHFVQSPDDLAATLALSGIAGLQGTRQSRRILFALPGAWIAGGLIGMLIPGFAIGDAAMGLSLLACGCLLAAGPRVPLNAATALSVAAGAFRGCANMSGFPFSPDALITLIGIAGSIFCCCALFAALVVQLRERWMRVAVQVFGSWIAATGLLLTGWALRR